MFIMKKLAAVLFVMVCCVNLSQGDDQKFVAGGVHLQNATDERFLKVATDGIVKLDGLKGEQCGRKVRKVVEAQTQVVAGTRYILKVELCTPEACDGKEQTPLCDTCVVDLWEQPWLNFLRVTNMNCPIQQKWTYKYSE